MDPFFGYSITMVSIRHSLVNAVYNHYESSNTTHIMLFTLWMFNMNEFNEQNTDLFHLPNGLARL